MSDVYNIKAEQSVIGAILMRGEIFHEISDILSQNDFYVSGHKIIYEAMSELNDKQVDIDAVTLTSYLEDKKKLIPAGGASYISVLLEDTVTSHNAKMLAKIVKESSIRRSLISIAKNIEQMAKDPDKNIDIIINECEGSLLSNNNETLKSEITPLRSYLKQTWDDLVEREHSGNNSLVTGVDTGIYELNDLTCGWQNSDLIVLCGRPSHGKTQLALNFCIEASDNDAIPLIFSLEMSGKSLGSRLISSMAEMNSQILRRGKLDKTKWDMIAEAIKKLDDYEMFIDETPAMSITNMYSKVKRFTSRNKIGMIVIDYLQLMKGTTYNIENRRLEVGEISRGLKAMAKEFNIPIVALSQLSRACESRPNKRPMLSDLRESGEIEQDADLILSIYRDELYYQGKDYNKNIVEIELIKQRNGPIGGTWMEFKKEYGLFKPLSAEKARAYVDGMRGKQNVD